MNKQEYKEYLKSEHWLTLRRLALHNARSHCQLCGSKKSLQVHHNTYSALGKERLDHLVVMCGRCHRKHHDILGDVRDLAINNRRIY